MSIYLDNHLSTIGPELTGLQDPVMEAIIKTTSVYGDVVFLRQSDIDRRRTILPLYTSCGLHKGQYIHRGNLDPTGQKFKASQDEIMKNPLFNVITAEDGRPFSNRALAKCELIRLVLTDTHNIVSARSVQNGLSGFLLQKKLPNQTK